LAARNLNYIPFDDGDAAFSRRAQWLHQIKAGLTVAVTVRDFHPLPYSPV